MVVAFIATRLVKGHPVWVYFVSDVATQPAVVGSERGVVQTPVLKVIVGSVSIPQEEEERMDGKEEGREEQINFRYLPLCNREMIGNLHPMSLCFIVTKHNGLPCS